MIIVILSIVALALSIFLTILFEKKDIFSLMCISGVFLIASFIACLGFGIASVVVRVNEEYKYQSYVEEYNILNERLDEMSKETDYSITMKDELYKDILEYNNSITENRLKSHNPWTSWLYYKKVGDQCKYIEFDRG